MPCKQLLAGIPTPHVTLFRANQRHIPPGVLHHLPAEHFHLDSPLGEDIVRKSRRTQLRRFAKIAAPFR